MSTINGKPYLNFLCCVLWCHAFIPSHAPTLPPNTDSQMSAASDMRHRERFAFHLSMPYRKNVMTLIAARYTRTIWSQFS